MKKVLILILISFTIAVAQTNPINDILANGNDLLKKVSKNYKDYELQIVYTQIDRDENNIPSFKTYRFGMDKDYYFYPASSVKFPAAVLALEKLNKLKIEGLCKYTPLKIDSVYSGQTAATEDKTSECGKPSIASYIKKIMLVSDNDAYNRMYEFLGQECLNKGLWAKGYKNIRLNHRLSIFLSEDENRHTNPFCFYNKSGVVYQQAPKYSELSFDLAPVNQQKGKGFYSGGELVEKPMDFSRKNFFALDDMHHILKAVMFPYAVPENERFGLTNSDYQLLYKYMGMFPRESEYPKYDYNDNYSKFLIFDGDEKQTGKVRIFNKIGMAYGFLIDNAYIADFENNAEFLISVVIHVNEDGVYNDDKYEYKTVGFPFLSELGRAFLDYELRRERKYTPVLTRFNLFN